MSTRECLNRIVTLEKYITENGIQYDHYQKLNKLQTLVDLLKQHTKSQMDDTVILSKRIDNLEKSIIENVPSKLKYIIDKLIKDTAGNHGDIQMLQEENKKVYDSNPMGAIEKRFKELEEKTNINHLLVVNLKNLLEDCSKIIGERFGKLEERLSSAASACEDKGIVWD